MNIRIFLFTCLSVVIGYFHSSYAAAPQSPFFSNNRTPVNRRQVVQRHNPTVNSINPQAPFTLGNGQFAFTADVTGLQSFPDFYFSNGIPLETRANWAWHSRSNPNNYVLADAFEVYEAYNRYVSFPTNMDSAAGQWLRQNPHDLPLARVFFLLDGKEIAQEKVTCINQKLDLWSGLLKSIYQLDGTPVDVETGVDGFNDVLGAKIISDLLSSSRLTVGIKFPRGYDISIKNTPGIIWDNEYEHVTEIIKRGVHQAVFRREADNSEHYVRLQWSGRAKLQKVGSHEYHLITSHTKKLYFSIAFSPRQRSLKALRFADIKQHSIQAWHAFWKSGAAIDFSESSNYLAMELERRIILSQYILASQSRAPIPAQETGLTSSSWYGKHHSEMTWWHSAHWVLWDRPRNLEQVLDWYLQHIGEARELAEQRGLDGARWAKMVGPDNRESPGGNCLIIWNQPQFIHLPDMLYRRHKDKRILHKYRTLVEETAQAMSSMLIWEDDLQRFSLGPPIWIAQEIYGPTETLNPAFELAYWREGLKIAQEWHKYFTGTINEDWQFRIDNLAPLPVKDNKYVAVESIPDTFDNINSRQDHPTMLAPFGLLNDPGVDKEIMLNTLNAVLDSWDWETKIWGWDYPMVAMTAARLQQRQTAVDILLADLRHNIYLPNGHVPQPGAMLPVYLPANGALLSAVAMMLGGWEGAPDGPCPGFPDDGSWIIKAEGFKPLL